MVLEHMFGGECSSLSGMYITDQESDFMAQLIRNCSGPHDHHQLGAGSTSWPNDHDESTTEMGNLFGSTQGSGRYSNGSLFRQDSCYNYLSDSHEYLELNDDSMTMDFCLGNEKITGNAQDDQGITQESIVNPCQTLHLGKESDHTDDSMHSSISKNKKRSANLNVMKNKRNVKARKGLKRGSDENNTDEKNDDVQSSSSSEENSDQIGGMTSSLSSKSLVSLNSTGKTRASRGSATDPQSLYARKRRERINERLRILQNLVPNGTKVDISTMLEEAVLYVKFLQLQIKLLSSDDLWMYAPLAYNGMDIGLDLKINMINDLKR